MEANTGTRKTSNATGKCQNISPILAVTFAGCIVTWGENIFESQILWKKAHIYLYTKNAASKF